MIVTESKLCSTMRRSIHRFGQARGICTVAWTDESHARLPFDKLLPNQWATMRAGMAVSESGLEAGGDQRYMRTEGRA